MKRLMIISAALFGTAHAQLLGSTDLVSKSSFCKKYGCQYVKLERSEFDEVWTYYISRRLNFDVTRNTASNGGVMYNASLRFVGGNLKNADLAPITDFLSAVVGSTILKSQLMKCNTTRTGVLLFRDDGVDGYNSINCRRIDATEIEFFAVSFSP